MQLIKTDTAIAPRAPLLAEHGSVGSYTTAAGASFLDLRTIGYQGGARADSNAKQWNGAVGTLGADRITVKAITTDVGVIFGTAQADVTTTNAPSLAAVNTVSGAGAVTAVAGCCYRIVAGTEKTFRLRQGVDFFMGFVSTGAGQMIVYQDNTPNE